MTQDILGNAATGTPCPREGPASEAVQAVAMERLLLAVLPQGWSVIGRCRFGTAVPGPTATGCHALAHPEIGIALIDIAPDATPNAESRLRRALSAVDFWSDFPGYLPVWHGRLDGPAIRGLARIVQDRFSTLPPLTVPGGQAWIGAVRQAMVQDAAWEVPGQAERPIAPLPQPQDPEEADEEPRRGWSRTLLCLGFLGTFGLGLATGLLLMPLPEPVPPSAAPAPPERAASVDPVPAAVPAPAEPTADPPRVESPAPAPAISAAIAEPAPTPRAEPVVEPDQAEPPPVATAPLPAEPGPEALTTARIQPVTPDSEEASAPAGTASEPELPPAPPPEPPAPAPRRTAEAPVRPGRAVSGIDRACVLALFRFQQGEALSAAEQLYLRSGCSTRR